MTTHDKDKIIAAARECNAFFDVIAFGRNDGTLFSTNELERFWQIAYEAGRQAERESINQDDGTIDWRGENEV